MNVRYLPICNPEEDPCAVPLAGGRGELLSVTIVADPRDLEDILDLLAESQYPIDPQIYHDADIDGHKATLVEFPAYTGWLEEIRGLLKDEAVTIRKCMTHAASN